MKLIQIVVIVKVVRLIIVKIVVMVTQMEMRTALIKLIMLRSHNKDLTLSYSM